ncbi:MAG: protein kinase, partial [Gemmatimonas sp.]
GGMATVYLARDVRHARHVAVKVLHPELAAVLGAERFLAEIKTTANLQHPHILPLFDSGAVDGQLFYVMPYVEGETLRSRLTRETQLPIADAIQLAREVADALQHAHERGVIHRDIKPENILLQGGHALVADFGIALAVQQAGSQRMTQTGLSLGTPQYMAPEQAMGEKTVDARSDVYALGAVTYEMLTGEPPFSGATTQAIVARVLTVPPAPIAQTRTTVPPHVEHAVLTALAKLPADRQASAAQYSAALVDAHTARPTGVARDAQPNPGAAGGTRRNRRELIAWGVAAVAFGTAAWNGMPRETPPAPAAKFDIALPDSVFVPTNNSRKLALSSNGERLAIAGARGGARSQIYVRRLDDVVAVPVRGTEGGTAPSFSPDDQWLLFQEMQRPGANNFAANAVRIVPAAGGSSRLVVDSAVAPSWSADGRHVLFTRRNGVWIVPSEGGEPRRLMSPDSTRGIVRVSSPEALPGGTHVLVTFWSTATGPQTPRLATVSIADGTFEDLETSGANARYVEPGYVLFGRPSGEVYAAPFSLKRRRITGPPTLLVQNVWVAGNGVGFAVSRYGMLAWHTSVGERLGAERSHLVSVDRQGVERPLTRDPQMFSNPRVAPDNRRVAVTIGGPLGEGRISLLDIESGVSTLLTSESHPRRPEWSHDGSHVYWFGYPGGDSAILQRRPGDLSAPAASVAQFTEEVLGGGGSVEFAPGPSRGLSVLRRGNVGPDVNQPSTLTMAPTESLTVTRPLITKRAAVAGPRVSPDGRLLAFSSGESGRLEVFVTPIPGPGPLVQLSADGGSEPIWSRNGRIVYFRSGQSNSDGRPATPTMMAATITESPSLGVVRRDSLFADVYLRDGTHSNYDVLGESGFVMVKALSGTAPAIRIYGLTNWMRLLGTAPAGSTP